MNKQNCASLVCSNEDDLCWRDSTWWFSYKY